MLADCAGTPESLTVSTTEQLRGEGWGNDGLCSNPCRIDPRSQVKCARTLPNSPMQ